MPLRGLMYFAQLYQMHLSRQGKQLFRSSIVKIPNPKFIVFYNGMKETEDREILCLSDAFEIEDKSGQYEWTAEMININQNHSQGLQKKCKPLYDYVRYVSRVKDNKKKGMSLNEAVSDAITWAIKESLLDGFFKIQKEEILANSLTEFDEEEFIRDIHQEGFDDGFSQGSLQKAVEAAITLVQKYNIAPKDAAKDMKAPLEVVLEELNRVSV